MKKIVICFILIFGVINFIFSNEKENKVDNTTDTIAKAKLILKEKHLSYPRFYLPRFANAIVGGASLIGMMIVPPIPGAILLTNPVYVYPGYNIGTILGIMTIAILELPLMVVGSIALGYGDKKFGALYNVVNQEQKDKFLNNSIKKYKIMGITTGALAGAFFTMLCSGVGLTVASLMDKQLYPAGICLDVFGGIGVGICIPLMIASLAMYSWCKGQLAKLTPELSFSHDSKKGFDEGYSVRMGLRVRI